MIYIPPIPPTPLLRRQIPGSGGVPAIFFIIGLILGAPVVLAGCLLVAEIAALSDGNAP